jgi:hypothetical protein
MTSLPAEEALGRLVQLFEAGSVVAEREGLSVRSVDIPLPLLNFDRRLYSRRNWVGINPFMLASEVEATAAPANGGGTLVVVNVDRLRLLGQLAIAVAVVLSIVVVAPLPGLAAAVFALGLCLLQFRWSHTLLRSEMKQALGVGSSCSRATR